MVGQIADIDYSKISKAPLIKEICLGPGPLPLEEFIAASCYGAKIRISQEYIDRVTDSQKIVEKILDENRVVYGLTTGFGDNVRTVIPKEQAVRLQYNILRSHAVSVGEPMPENGVRAIWLMQLLSLGQGYSGIRIETLQLIVECLNRGILPFAPRYGSVQALPIEANINLVLIGEGKAWYKGRLIVGSEALKEAGLNPVKLGCKEGLCLTNGANSATALSALALYHSILACQAADITALMAYSLCRNTVKAGGGIRINAEEGSDNVSCDRSTINTPRDGTRKDKSSDNGQQIPLEITRLGKTHGIVKSYIKDAGLCIMEEMASCSDNPIVWPDGKGDGVALMGANFDSTFASGGADILTICAANLARLVEKRIKTFINNHYSCFQPSVVKDEEAYDDSRAIHHAAAALVNEIRGHSLPATVDSIPTCANWEDPVSMGMWAAQKAWKVSAKLEYLVAMELVIYAKAFDRIQKGYSEFDKVHQAVRDMIYEMALATIGSTSTGLDVEQAYRLVSNGEIVRNVETITGRLPF